MHNKAELLSSSLSSREIGQSKEKGKRRVEIPENQSIYAKPLFLVFLALTTFTARKKGGERDRRRGDKS